MEGGSAGAGRLARFLARGGTCRLITLLLVAMLIGSAITASFYPANVFSRASVILNGQTLKRNLSAFPKPGALLDVEEEPGTLDAGDGGGEDDNGRTLPAGDGPDEDYAWETGGGGPEERRDKAAAGAAAPDDDVASPGAQSVPGNPGPAPGAGSGCDGAPAGPYGLPALPLTEPDAVPATRITSFATNFGTISGVGTYTKRYWLLQNVQLTNETTLTFFHSPKTRPPPPNVADLIYGNASSAAAAPALPTAAVMRSGQTRDWATVHLRFLSAAEKQPACARWEHRPVYLLTMQHTENVFHAWTDGLLGAFQTLREQGRLPLAEVDAEGGMAEYTADLPEDCPREFDPPAHRLAPAADTNASAEAAAAVVGCRPRRGAVAAGARCDPARQPWCRPGLVAPGAWDPAAGPVLLPFPGVEVAPQWAHMFGALSAEILSWNRSDGTCFREVYMGRSNVLNFYMPLEPSENATARTVASAAAAAAVRAEAIAAVKALMVSAERAHREEEAALAVAAGEKRAEWTGYEDPGVERLRRGVGPGEAAALGALRPTKARAMELADMTEEEWDELEALLQASEKAVGKAARDAAARRRRRRQQRHRRALAEGAKPPKKGKRGKEEENGGEQARPVVTYMWRGNFKRSVLNAGDVLAYVLARYNVTVRVTTFEEPLLESMELMGATDVLIGMHGAGWANGLFVRRGAAALQLLPYGWVRDDGSAIRGQAFEAMARANDCAYAEWANADPARAFMRRADFEDGKAGVPYALHPLPAWGLPADQRPGNQWVYQNTVMDVRDVAPAIDAAMEAAGIEPMGD